ncbi:MAG: lipase family protein [Woeseiaceae bacterium]|nr:lipase family protein [Woeseiaceae bacterium]
MFDIEALKVPSFSWASAHSMALASKLAYADAGDVVAGVNGWGFDEVRHLSNDDTQCFVCIGPNVAMLAFRGTESFGDWMTNIQFVSKDLDYGRVHKGFYRAFEDVRSELRAMLRDAAPKHVFYCGHSLGGALATIAIAETADIAADYKAGYTFGQPKTGKSDFRDHFNAHHGEFFRFENDGDIVPRVPPGYRHVDELILLTDSLSEGFEAASVDLQDLNEEEFEVFRADLLEKVTHYRTEEAGLEGVVPSEDEYLEGIIPGVAAHDMDLYVSRIRERLEGQ